MEHIECPMPAHIGEIVTKVIRSMKAATTRRKTMTTEKKILKVYTIIDSKKEGGKGFWLEIGRAYTNKDDSLNIRLNALPVNGSLHIREDNNKPTE